MTNESVWAFETASDLSDEIHSLTGQLEDSVNDEDLWGAWTLMDQIRSKLNELESELNEIDSESEGDEEKEEDEVTETQAAPLTSRSE